MLVLSTTFYTRWMTRAVPRQPFQNLLERTRGVLRNLSENSAAWRARCCILERISKLLFEAKDAEPVYVCD